MKQFNAFFLHNWRCAGTTVTSVLSSNYTDRYIKIGCRFTEFGYPDHEAEEYKTLKDIRRVYRPGCIVGGHMFMGLQAFLPGDWQVWSNVRSPLERMESGILRFHAIEHASSKNLIQSSRAINSEEDIRRILNNDLAHECNGISKRIAGLSVCHAVDIDEGESHLEKMPFLSKSVLDKTLFRAAAMNLQRINVLLMAKEVHASLLCIETKYGLGPLINPFSNLRLNSVGFGKATDEQKELVRRCRPLIAGYSKVDLKLWPLLEEFFAKQLSKYAIKKEDVAIRELIHKEPLVHPSWLSEGRDKNALIKLWATRIGERAAADKELGPQLIETVCSWRRLSPEIADQIRHYSLKVYHQC